MFNEFIDRKRSLFNEFIDRKRSLFNEFIDRKRSLFNEFIDRKRSLFNEFRRINGVSLNSLNLLNSLNSLNSLIFCYGVDIAQVASFTIVVKTIAHDEVVGNLEAAVRNVKFYFQVARLYE